MQNPDPFLLRQINSAPAVVRLRFRDRIGFNPEPMRELYRNHGAQVAEERVCAALEEIARCLEAASAAHHASEFARLALIATRLVSAANRIGLDCVARVARDVGICAERGDDMATAATMQRLDRITEPAMTEVWNTYDEAP